MNGRRRADENSDFAPDASVYPEAPDPKRIEHLAFEVCSEQALSVPTEGLSGPSLRPRVRGQREAGRGELVDP